MKTSAARWLRAGGVIALAVTACGGGPPPPGRAPPAPVDGIDPAEVVAVIPRDAIRAIDNPTFDTPEEAEAYLRPEELVLGVELAGEARAYPIAMLSAHEIVNDRIGATAIAVTW